MQVARNVKNIYIYAQVVCTSCKEIGWVLQQSSCRSASRGNRDRDWDLSFESKATHLLYSLLQCTHIYIYFVSLEPFSRFSPVFFNPSGRIMSVNISIYNAYIYIYMYLDNTRSFVI